MVYHNYYANYDYGSGKIYLTGVRSNNGAGSLSNVGGNLIGNNPALLTGAVPVSIPVVTSTRLDGYRTPKLRSRKNGNHFRFCPTK